MSALHELTVEIHQPREDAFVFPRVMAADVDLRSLTQLVDERRTIARQLHGLRENAAPSSEAVSLLAARLRVAIDLEEEVVFGTMLRHLDDDTLWSISLRLNRSLSNPMRERRSELMHLLTDANVAPDRRMSAQRPGRP